MDSIRRREPRYEVRRTLRLEDLAVEDILHTHCVPGLFRGRFERADPEEVVSRRNGTTYLRLTIRFRLAEGPYVHKDGKWQAAGSGHAGRVVAVWQELETGEDGRPLLSPNAWFTPAVMGSPGKTLADKLRHWGAAVRWVAVRRPAGRPARVSGVSFTEDPPDPEWVARCTAD